MQKLMSLVSTVLHLKKTKNTTDYINSSETDDCKRYIIFSFFFLFFCLHYNALIDLKTDLNRPKNLKST
jgi:hypothetical protein